MVAPPSVLVTLLSLPPSWTGYQWFIHLQKELAVQGCDQTVKQKRLKVLIQKRNMNPEDSHSQLLYQDAGLDCNDVNLQRINLLLLKMRSFPSLFPLGVTVSAL